MRSQRATIATLVGPAACWLGVFMFAPLVIILVFSVTTRGEYGQTIYAIDLHHYLQFVDRLYLLILARSFYVAGVTTLATLLIGYPFAYYVARAPAEKRNFLLLLIVIPFWTNFLLRTYAWVVILRAEGVINSILTGIGLIDKPLAMLYNTPSVILGSVYGFLPFMVLPLYTSIEKLDWSLIEAAFDLGARPWQAFLRVTLPLTLPGIVAGSILTFIPALGMFVIPDLMGGAKTVLVGNLIQNQFLTARNWQFGSAASVILMALVIGGLLVYGKIAGFEEEKKR